jgi:hypothetical protein
MTRTWLPCLLAGLAVLAGCTDDGPADADADAGEDNADRR